MTNLPTLLELYNDIVASLEAEYGVLLPSYGKVFLRALAAVQAAKLKLYYYRIGFLQKNIFVDTADPVDMGGTLERFGTVKGLTRRPATQGLYSVDVTGLSGSVIPALTQFKSDDDSQSPGYLYILDTAFTFVLGTGTITLRALVAGVDNILAVGNTLTATSPIVNVSQLGTVSAIAVAPIAQETIEEFRARILQAYRLSPQGGSSADYRLWGLDAAGVRQIYPYTPSGLPNEVDVFVEAVLADSTDGKGTPTSTILTDVAADIEADPVTGRGRRPLAVLQVNVQAIVPLDVDITIDSNGVLTSAQQLLISDALTAYMYGVRPFIPGADVLATRNDTISDYSIGRIVLQAVPGVLIASISLDVNSVTVSSYLFDFGEIPYPNSFTFI
jgi:uncharacterized phage protein gp47/JayE